MAPRATFLCLCCNKYLTEKRERAHRRKAYHPYRNAEAPDTRSHRKVDYFSQPLQSDSEGEHDRVTPEGDIDQEYTRTPTTDEPMADIGVPTTMSPLPTSPLPLFTQDDALLHWDAPLPVLREWDPSDSEEDSRSETDEVPAEDDTNDDETDIVDWDAIERDCGMSAWDKLGKGYEADAAKIGMKLHLSSQNLRANLDV